MINKFGYCLISLVIIILSIPSVGFAESKIIEGEYCKKCQLDQKNKAELEQVRFAVIRKAIENGLHKLTDASILVFTDECLSHAISNYLEKLVVVSHTEKGRKICDKVEMSVDPEAVSKYLSQKQCISVQGLGPFTAEWDDDINKALSKKSEKINIGLIIESKIKELDGYKSETLENQEEKQFSDMIERNKEKYKLVNKRHLKKILEEERLSNSDLKDSEALKLGKLLNLDVIVLRIIYDGSQVTKVLKVSNGEVLLFKTYKVDRGDGGMFDLFWNNNLR